MDRWADHSLVCSCNGDRTLRHNALRDLTFRATTDARLVAEREKAGLLPGRPQEDGLAASASARRPADIWLQSGIHGDNEALDFAVTSGLRNDRYRECVENPSSVLAEYEAYKREYKERPTFCAQLKDYVSHR